MLRVVGYSILRLASHRAAHGGAHRSFHVLMILGFAVNDAADLILAFGDYDMRFDRSCLTEPPASAHRLVILLI